METKRLESLKQIADGIAAQFGSNCEVVIHEVSSSRMDHSIVYIVNGHVSGRKIGDGASQVALEQMLDHSAQPKDHLSYLTKTPDGKILKSSSIYIRNSRGYQLRCVQTADDPADHRRYAGDRRPGPNGAGAHYQC